MNDRGLTLIEIMVVIIVLGLLAGLVGPRILGRVSEARSATARTQIELIGVALDSYRLDTGRYPTTEQGLAALREAPTREPVPRNWRGPYLQRAVPLDPWEREYLYVSPGEVNPESYDLYTLGRDGIPGGEGEDTDVRGWE
ncbi:MAG: type II secretion system major pseudopilin GspG [Gemmatimonadota bacterium]|jgi:general secretion pathway protein G